MTKEQIVTLKERRLKLLEEKPINFKSNGVIKKLRRELRNLKK